MEKTHIRSYFRTFFLILHVVLVFDMKKIIYNKYDKALISNLPVAEFKGRIIVVMSAGETEKAVNYLLSQPMLGVDTETRPSFRKGDIHKVALLQVSTIDTCFLFRLNMTDITPAIMRLLENTQVPMIGLSWHDDILSLQRRRQFTPGRFIDLQDLVGELGIEDLSLQKIFANIFQQKISKRQQLTNWDAAVLSEKQKCYAATDAWACLKLYGEIRRLIDSHDYELISVQDEL